MRCLIDECLRVNSDKFDDTFGLLESVFKVLSGLERVWVLSFEYLRHVDKLGIDRFQEVNEHQTVRACVEQVVCI